MALDRKMKLTEHFALHEFVSPNDRHGWSYLEQNWSIFRPRLLLLASVLEDARAHFRKVHGGNLLYHIYSGMRSPQHNRAVGGAMFSQHKEARAADGSMDGVPLGQLRDYFMKHPAVGGVGYYPNQGFVHVDVRPGRVLGGKPFYWEG